MIITLLFTMVYGLITTVFAPIPGIPPMPQGIVDALNLVLDLVRFGAEFMALIFGSALWQLVLAALVAMLAMEQIYHLAMFIMKKLPFLAIK